MTKFWIERKEIMTVFEGGPERIATMTTAYWRSDLEKTRRLRAFAETRMILLCEAPAILRAIWERGKGMLAEGSGCQSCYGHYHGGGTAAFYKHDYDCQWPALDGMMGEVEQCES